MRLQHVLLLAGSLLLGLPVVVALADYDYLDALGVHHTVFSFTCQTIKLCTSFVLVDSTGTEKATAANPITVSVNSWASGSLGAMANYGSSPGTVLVPGVNAFVTNANANGAASPVNSSPVTLPVLSHASVTALGTSLVVKASVGNLNGFNCTAITGGGAGFCIAYNATTVPSTGALTGSLVLDSCYFDTTARGCSLAHVNGSTVFSVGIVILVTSAATPFTYTTGTDTAFVSADYQ